MKEAFKKYVSDAAKARGGHITVGLLGLGKTNRAALDILREISDTVDITVRSREPVRYPLPDTVKPIFGQSCFDGIDEDVLIPSPSVRRENIAAKDSAVYVTDYDILFAKKRDNLFFVSGSNGKSTTTSIASLLLYPRFPDLFTGGNLGVPLFLAPLNKDAFLIELSSFTLRYTQPSGGRALLTNVTPNHLDWHADLDEYVDAKLSLIRSCDEPILNLDDEVSRKAAAEITSFALTSDTLTHSEILRKYKTEHTVTLENGYICLCAEPIVATSEIRRKERHNLRNLASAIALSIGYADRDHLIKVATEFSGLSERCEAFTHLGVEYVSSSIDTTPERTRATLLGLNRRVRIILGGRGKGLELEPLREPLLLYADRISVYGEIRDAILDFIKSDPALVKIPHGAFEKFRDAVYYATEDVNFGDTVLLSPAATSYGEFTSYVERGETFKSLIKNKNTPQNITKQRFCT